MRPTVARHAVVAEALEQRRGSRALRSRASRTSDSSKSATRLAAGARARRRWPGDQWRPAQPRGRSDSSPAPAFDSYQFTRSQPDFSPKAAPCSRCQRVGRATPAAAGRPRARGPGSGCRSRSRRSRARARACTTGERYCAPKRRTSMCQRSSDGSPSAIHSAITLPDAAGAGQPVRAEPGRHEQPADLGLAEAELVVGREGLRAVDHPRDLHVLHLRNAPARVHDDLLEAVPVVLEQPAVEVGRDAVEAGRVAVGRKAGAERRS